MCRGSANPLGAMKRHSCNAHPVVARPLLEDAYQPVVDLAVLLLRHLSLLARRDQRLVGHAPAGGRGGRGGGRVGRGRGAGGGLGGRGGRGGRGVAWSGGWGWDVGARLRWRRVAGFRN